MSHGFFDGFELETVDAGDVPIRIRRGGSGPPLLLLHGMPQTHAMWHKVAPMLAERFTVVCTDLRGYGDSGKPPTVPDHATYSKRAMARDQVEVMRALGFERFGVTGHDRGGRVGYRMALDHTDRVERLAVLDIIPTAEHLARADMSFGLGYYHWFLYAQPSPIPERFLQAGLESTILARAWDAIDPVALAEYRRCFADPAVRHAICEDYRAAVGIDREHDEADRGNQRIVCPLLALWGGRNYLDRWYDVLSIWRDWADDVSGGLLDCGHFLAEERPDELATRLANFFSRGDPDRPR